jgi:type I restriction enzyme S subunit
MAGEWRESTVDEIASPARNALVGGPFGSNLVSSDYVVAGVPVIRGQNMGGRWVSGEFAYVTDTKAASLKANLARPGDIVFTQRGTLGQVSVVPVDKFDRYLVSQSQMKLTVNRELADPMFIYYVFSTAEQQDYIRQNAIQTGVPHTNLGILRGTPVPLPPLPEQRAIAHILGTLDDKIELNRRMNETLEAMARALFKSWFVDFDPVRAKAEGRDPGLPKPLADLFPDSFEDSELGEIPKGWRVRVLHEVLTELETGSRPKGGVSGYTTGTPSVGAESIVGLGVFDFSKTKYVPQAFFDAMIKGRVQNRDVLLYKDGGRPGEFEPHVALFGDGFPFDTCAINEHVYRMRAKEEMGQNLLFFWLSSDLVMEEMRIKGTGVAIPGLNSTQVKSLTTLVPTGEVARAFDGLVEPWITRVLVACNESRTLAALRDTLLPKLISGELRVKDAERFAGVAS